MVPAASRPTDVEKFRTCDAPRMNRDVRFTLRSGHAPTPLLQERAISRSDPERVSGRHDRPVPCSALQHPTGSSALGGGSERTNGIRARCARAGHPDRPPREQAVRAVRCALGGQVSRATASNAARSAQCARLRPQQLQEASSRCARARSVFVGSLVRWVGDVVCGPFGAIAPAAGSDLVGAERLAAPWAHRRERAAAHRMSSTRRSRGDGEPALAQRGDDARHDPPSIVAGDRGSSSADRCTRSSCHLATSF